MPKKKPADPKILPPAEFDKVVDTHNAASQGKTPARARQALLAAPITVGDYIVHPPSLSIQILLEEIDHPILKITQAETEEQAAKVEMSGRDVLRLIFVFTQPEEAYRVIGYSRENFEAHALEFGFSVPPALVPELMQAIRHVLTSASQTIPGATTGGGQTAGDGDPLA